MTTKALGSRQKKASANRIFVVATSSDYQKLCVSSLKRLPSQGRVELVSLPKVDKGAVLKAQQHAALLVSRLADITKETLERACVTASTRQLVFLEGLPVEAVASRLLPLNIRNPERIHIAAQSDRSSMEELIFRMFSGMTESDGSHPIVDAWVENEKLVLLSPTFSRLEIPLEKLVRFVGSNKAEVGAFEIDEDGSFLHWPHADVHLGWLQFQQIIDPAVVVTTKKKTAEYNLRYGEAIRAMRESRGLKHSEIAGVTDRQIRRVEHGQQSASKPTLEALAKAHSMSLADYVEELAKRVTAVS